MNEESRPKAAPEVRLGGVNYPQDTVARGGSGVSAPPAACALVRVGQAVDEILPWLLPAEARAVWDAGFEAGVAVEYSVLQPQLERERYVANYWYFRACNPGKDFYAAQTARLWAEAVAS